MSNDYMTDSGNSNDFMAHMPALAPEGNAPSSGSGSATGAADAMLKSLAGGGAMGALAGAAGGPSDLLSKGGDMTSLLSGFSKGAAGGAAAGAAGGAAAGAGMDMMSALGAGASNVFDKMF